jgi:hypothetical protein
VKVMFRCVNDDVMIIKPGLQTTGNACVIWLDKFPTLGRVYVWRTPKNSSNPECVVPKVKHRVRFCDGLGISIVILYSVGLILTLHGKITARVYVDRLGNQVHPMIQTLFPNDSAVFQDDSAPIHTAGI